MTPSVGNVENDTEDVTEGHNYKEVWHLGWCLVIKNANYKEVLGRHRKMIYKFFSFPFIWPISKKYKSQNGRKMHQKLWLFVEGDSKEFLSYTINHGSTNTSLHLW
jgi:hypothetical protein